MNTFIEVDGQAYSGILSRQVRQLANLAIVKETYLSAHGPFGSVSVSFFNEFDEDPVAESALRDILAEVIRKKLSRR